MNFMIRTLVIKIIKSLKLRTLSQEGSSILLFVFFMTYFNTAILILIVNCNFEESKSNILRHIFSIGAYTDFNKGWYQVMGPLLLLTVLFNAFVPLGIVLKNATIYYLKRSFDNGCFRKKY